MLQANDNRLNEGLRHQTVSGSLGGRPHLVGARRTGGFIMLPCETPELVRANLGALASLKPGEKPILPSRSVTSGEFRDLAPRIHRQRLVVEGYPTYVITDAHIKDYLSKLSAVTDMSALIEPVTHISDLYGWAGWIHWETSGAHFYS